MFRAITRAAVALVTATVLGAQTASPAAPPPAQDLLHQPAQNLTISLLTMGHGDQVWELFGHNALWIHDNVSGRDTVFNWGVFDFKQPNFIPRFLKGQMLYAMGGDSLQWVSIVYRYLNRSVTAQELDLTPAEKDSVLKQIAWYARPENVNYRYDYFRDNCSTRVRDILDNALRGQLRAQAGGLTGTTYRSHALRLMQVDRPIVLGVNIGLGGPSDVELTKWQEMFLPRKLHDFVGAFQVRDSTGALRPLVKSERSLVESSRPPEGNTPPVMWPWLFGAGLLFAGLFAWLGTSSSTAGRRSGAVVLGVWTATAGLLGLVLTLLGTVTDHVAAHSNANLLLFNPLWLALAVPLTASLWSGRPSVWARRLALAVAGLAIVAVLVHVVRLSVQDNFALIGLALPPALAIAWITSKRGVPRDA